MVRVRATAPPAGTPAKIKKQGGRFLDDKSALDEL